MVELNHIAESAGDTITLDPDADMFVLLPATGGTWPTGTTAYLRALNADGTTLHEFPAVVTPEYLRWKVEKENHADIPAGTAFKIGCVKGGGVSDDYTLRTGKFKRTKV